MLEKRLKIEIHFFENITTRDINTYLYLTQTHVSFS